jgi:DNA repair protein RecO (recombination protein O)
MQWSADAVVLGCRRHGEAGVILEVMTREHGRHLGLVRGGRSRRLQPTLQPGNLVAATWKARLAEQLGIFIVEARDLRAARLMESASTVHAAHLLAAHLRLLPERDPHARLFDALNVILERTDDGLLLAELLVRFELALLEDLGFGLDLSKCASTGDIADLVYVSPKTGRAVSAGAGAPFRNRMFALPAFLVDRANASPNRSDIQDGFKLTGHFLERHIYHPRNIAPPDSRSSFLQDFNRGSS